MIILEKCLNINQKLETHGKNVGIAQIEITNLEKAVNNYREVIVSELNKLRNLEKLDYILFTGIDIVKGFNILIAVDEESDRFFSKALGIQKIGDGYKTKDIIMRKQIWPKVESVSKAEENARLKKMGFGCLKGKIWISDDFNDEDPEINKMFYGEDGHNLKNKN